MTEEGEGIVQYIGILTCSLAAYPYPAVSFAVSHTAQQATDTCSNSATPNNTPSPEWLEFRHLRVTS
jgi:hypothetical protein